MINSTKKKKKKKGKKRDNHALPKKVNREGINPYTEKLS